MLEAPPVVSHAPRRNDSEHPAHAAWALAPLIAGQPAYRRGRRVNGALRYQQSATHPITGTLPAAPAAVMIHDVDGSVRTLCLDLDTSRTARRAVVDADAARLGRLLTGVGLAFVEDRSPSGGRHLYVPLQDPITAADARRLVEALQLHAPSLDPGPHQNVTDGCIRVPGSLHKLGGHQMLITPLTEAYGILRRRNSAAALTALDGPTHDHRGGTPSHPSSADHPHHPHPAPVLLTGNPPTISMTCSGRLRQGLTTPV